MGFLAIHSNYHVLSHTGTQLASWMVKVEVQVWFPTLLPTTSINCLLGCFLKKLLLLLLIDHPKFENCVHGLIQMLWRDPTFLLPNTSRYHSLSWLVAHDPSGQLPVNWVSTKSLRLTIVHEAMNEVWHQGHHETPHLELWSHVGTALVFLTRKEKSHQAP